MKKILGLVALATLLFASCQKEEGVKVDQQPKSVTVKLHGITPVTKSMQETAAAEDQKTQAVLNDVNILFVTTGGELVRGYESTGSTADGTAVVAKHYYTSEEITTNAFSSTFHFLPSNVDEVIVIGNYGSDIYVDGDVKTETALKALGVTLETTQTQSNGKVAPYLILYGTSGLTKKNPSAHDPAVENHDNIYTANVKIEPIVSRFEVTGFTYNAIADQDDEDGYLDRLYKEVTVEKVIFHNFESKSTIVEQTVTADATNDRKYDVLPGNFSAWYAGITDAWWNDAQNIKITNGDIDAPVGETVWSHAYTGTPASGTDGEDGYVAAVEAKYPSYNVFPNQSVKPQIIVKFSAVNAKTNATESLYLKAVDFYETNPDQNITLTKNYVYKVNFEFDDNAWKNEERCVEVSVSVNPWNVVTVVPEF